MLEPPDVKHAMEVAKKQSDVSFSSWCSLGAHWAHGPAPPQPPVHAGLTPVSDQPNFYIC